MERTEATMAESTEATPNPSSPPPSEKNKEAVQPQAQHPAHLPLPQEKETMAESTEAKTHPLSPPLSSEKNKKAVQPQAQVPAHLPLPQEEETNPAKKRERPRKYAPDGSLAVPSRPGVPPLLNPTRISVSVPAVEFCMANLPQQLSRGRLGNDGGGGVKNIELERLGQKKACSAGANFTPHIIIVGAGQDVTMKVISFSQQGPRAICILSANGIISNVTLRQPDSSGSTLTYEGRYELLSLSGSFVPCDNKGTKSMSGAMSVSFSGLDGRVVGGGIGGPLVAASPIQVIVGSFLPSE